MFVAWLFKLGGIIFGIMAVTVLIVLLLGLDTPDGPKVQIATLLIVTAMGVALFAAGRMMAHHDRRGAIIGLALTLYPVILAPFTDASMDRFDMVVTAVIALLVLSVWRDLAWHGTPRAV
jgi:hypothetical protein